MSGIFFNDEQSLNKLLILDIFHFEISGIFSKESKFEKRLLISVILSIIHFDKSGREVINLHPRKISLILVVSN